MDLFNNHKNWLAFKINKSYKPTLFLELLQYLCCLCSPGTCTFVESRDEIRLAAASNLIESIFISFDFSLCVGFLFDYFIHRRLLIYYKHILHIFFYLFFNSLLFIVYGNNLKNYLYFVFHTSFSK